MYYIYFKVNSSNSSGSCQGRARATDILLRAIWRNAVRLSTRDNNIICKLIGRMFRLLEYLPAGLYIRQIHTWPIYNRGGSTERAITWQIMHSRCTFSICTPRHRAADATKAKKTKHREANSFLSSAQIESSPMEFQIFSQFQLIRDFPVEVHDNDVQVVSALYYTLYDRLWIFCAFAGDLKRCTKYKDCGLYFFVSLIKFDVENIVYLYFYLNLNVNVSLTSLEQYILFDSRRKDRWNVVSAI